MRVKNFNDPVRDKSGNLVPLENFGGGGAKQKEWKSLETVIGSGTINLPEEWEEVRILTNVESGETWKHCVVLDLIRPMFDFLPISSHIGSGLCDENSSNSDATATYEKNGINSIHLVWASYGGVNNSPNVSNSASIKIFYK